MNPDLAFRIYHDGQDWIAIVTGSPRYSGTTGIEAHPLTALHELIAAIYSEDLVADAAEDLCCRRPGVLRARALDAVDRRRA